MPFAVLSKGKSFHFYPTQGVCPNCGAYEAEALHVPLDVSADENTWYCSKCCPDCTAVSRPKEVAQEVPELREEAGTLALAAMNKTGSG
jgi:hypothetical protein